MPRHYEDITFVVKNAVRVSWTERSLTLGRVGNVQDLRISSNRQWHTSMVSCEALHVVSAWKMRLAVKKGDLRCAAVMKGRGAVP